MACACCIGSRIDAWTPRVGVVHRAFTRAANLRFGDQVGAAITTAPLPCFSDAIAALAAQLQGDSP